MAKSIDFWSGNGVEFDAKKALGAMAEQVGGMIKNDPGWALDAPRLTIALATKPRTAEGKPESSIFQSFKGIPVGELRAAGVKVLDGQVTFTGFSDDAAGMASLDSFLTQAGALRRTTVSRTKGWPFVSDPALASTPKLSPTERVGSIAGAKQISIALPPAIAKHLPTWASASAMVGFAVECGLLGITQHDLEGFLAQAKQAKDKADKDKADKDKADPNDNNDNDNDGAPNDNDNGE